MCGIYSVISKNDVLKDILTGLKSLEYRGYDSSGIAFLESDKLKIIKSVGYVDNLVSKLNNQHHSHIGIAHTRWATHGEVNEVNAHPHSYKDIAVVLNGIIENYIELKIELENEGYKFSSQTDAEIVPIYIYNLIEKGYSLMESLAMTLKHFRGSWSFVLLKQDHNKLYAVRKGSPIIIGICEHYMAFSSDINSFPKEVKETVSLKDGEIAVIDHQSFSISTQNFEDVPRETLPRNIVENINSKNNYETFMEKEINEQPFAIKSLFDKYLNTYRDKVKTFADMVIGKSVTIIACGSSYYAALMIKKYADILLQQNFNVELASEFPSNHQLYSDTYIFISQSGETKETMNCIDLINAKDNTKNKIAIVNNVNTAIPSLCDLVLPIEAGVEISVASTKAFTNQYFIFIVLIAIIQNTDLEIQSLIDDIYKVLNTEISQSTIQTIVSSKFRIFSAKYLLSPIAYEAALKLKEISYLPSKAIISGELKHGPISIIDESIIVIFLVNSQCSSYSKILNSINEIKLRKGKIVAICDRGARKDVNKLVDHIIEFDYKTSMYLSPILFTIVCQKLAYSVAKFLHREIDKPRNLAKSVTVE